MELYDSCVEIASINGTVTISCDIFLTKPYIVDESLSDKIDLPSIYGFSSCVKTLHSEGGDCKCFVSINPRGHGQKNKGYVSILIWLSELYTYFEGICIISIIDSSDSERFPKTFIVPHRTISPFVIHKYISRKQLLSDPDDLISNSILTLEIYLHLTVYPHEKSALTAISDLNFNFNSVSDGEIWIVGSSPMKSPFHLRLDSPLFKRLSEESIFFRKILDVPMTEKRTREMPIDIDEFSGFKKVSELIMGTYTYAMELTSITEIFDMYMIADKYDIPSVKETCICCLKLYASIHGASELFKCVNEYDVEGLKDVLNKEIHLISKINFAEETVKTDTEVSLKQPCEKHSWIYAYSNEDCIKRLIFKNAYTKHNLHEELKKDKCDMKNNDKEQYDFYVIK